MSGENIENSKWKKYATIVTAISASLAIIYGVAEAGMSFDSKYIKSASYQEILDKRYVVLAQYQLNEKQKEIRVLEDKVFELQMKVETGTATPVDRAMLARYKDRLRDLRSN